MLLINCCLLYNVNRRLRQENCYSGMSETLSLKQDIKILAFLYGLPALPGVNLVTSSPHHPSVCLTVGKKRCVFKEEG